MRPLSYEYPEFRFDGTGNPLSVPPPLPGEQILRMVRDSLEKKNALLAFQPVVSAMAPERAAFYEGLIRVFDDKGRIVPAKDFIATCEPHEIGRTIDCLALEFGLRSLIDAPALRLSINMSARSICHARWMETLHQHLDEDATIAERLVIEITEASIIETSDITLRFMHQLQDLGICFALDDFGTGYTSFRCLRDLEFDIVKIDGEFVRGIHDNPDNQALTEALVFLARRFDMLTVAECVECQEDADTLIDLGVDCLQGYFFGQPTTSPAWPEFRSGTETATAPLSGAVPDGKLP